MFLKRLRIANEFKLIREIDFQPGINLIVDETRRADPRSSGNNVGKTTILRLIDFCFGSSGKNIYADTEFKGKSNSQVEKFLTENNIIITLTLTEDLQRPDAREVEVRRNFLHRGQKILEINGEPQTVKEFPRELKRVVFGSDAEKPTARQIAAKNIRDEKNRLTNTLKVLDPHTTLEEYESLYLFWFGIDVDSEARKQQLLRDRKVQQAVIDSLKRETSLSEVEQSLFVVNRAIDDLDRKRAAFGVNSAFTGDLDELNDVKRRLNELTTRLTGLDVRRSMILESREELGREVSVIEPERVRELYEEAQALLPDLQRTFEETLAFHNQMVQNKADFITRELPALEAELNSARNEIARLLASERRLTEGLRRLGVIDELRKVVALLNEAHERRGALEEQKRMWDTASSRIEEINEELREIGEGLESKDALLKKRISEFNKYFSDISYRLYDERFVLSAERTDRALELRIGSVGGNLGTGKKRVEIAAFDLAYIQFADSEGIPCLHFVLQDQIENVHDNQISALLTEVVSDVRCQYVLPVLRDKLPGDMDVDPYVVVSLSQTDKLFRI